MFRPVAAMFLLSVVIAAGCGESGDGPRPVRLALDFQPNAVHAGVYAAISDGADERHDVSLELRLPSSSTDSLKLLAAGRADMAVVDIHDLALARERGSDIVGVGALVQRPLAAVIARDDVRRPADLIGRRIGVTGLPSDDAILRAVLGSDGVRLSKVRRVTIGFSAVPSLVAGRVDAVVTFWNAEGVVLRRRGVGTREFRVDRYGAPRYPELVLAVERSTLRQRPALVSNALAALRDGTREALADPDAAIGQVVKQSGADRAEVRAQFRALEDAFRPPIRLEQEALEAWADFDVRFGILERRPRVGRAFFLGGQ